jgi:hypothetical protein
MDSSFTRSPDAASTGPASPFHADPAAEPATPPKRHGWIEGHCPDVIEPLEAPDADSAVAQTRYLRHDGWTPEKMRLFLQRFAECGVLREACEASGMSARSYYNLLDRDPLFAAGLEAARVKARNRLADETFARSLNGCIERIYKDGVIVAERHRHDNRLSMAVLARLDARADRAEQRGEPHLRLAARWDEYLDALGEGRREDGLALLADPASSDADALESQPQSMPREFAGDRELRELLEDGLGQPGSDDHGVWKKKDGWWTDYPPPPGFDGAQSGAWGDEDYKRRLSPAEQARVDAEVAESDAADRALADAQRDAFFGFTPKAGSDDCQVRFDPESVRRSGLDPGQGALPNHLPKKSPVAGAAWEDGKGSSGAITASSGADRPSEWNGAAGPPDPQSM